MVNVGIYIDRRWLDPMVNVGINIPDTSPHGMIWAIIL